MRIIIKVERCFPGNRWRMTTPNGNRETLHAEKWTKRESSRALDLFENVYHYRRKDIHFEIK